MIRIIALAGLMAVTPLEAPVQSDYPTIEILWPLAGASITLGNDDAKAVGVVVRSNFRLLAGGTCGEDKRCGHLHLKIDPDGTMCNAPGKPYNSMNSVFGGDLIKANFGYCAKVAGTHVIGILLADDHHRPIIINGKPVTALVTVTTRQD